MIEFSVRRPVAVTMICVGLVVLGAIAARKIPVQLLPKIETPEFTILTSFKGATPEEVESMISIPLERAVSTLAGLEKTGSTSERERSEIRLHFKSNINYTETVSQLRDRLDSAGLPEGATRPKIVRFQANAAPVLRFALKSKDSSISPFETAQMIREVLIRKMESVDGVALATLAGAPEKKIEVVLEPLAIQALGISMAQIPELIQAKNKSFSAGEIEHEGKKTSIKLGQSLGTIEDLRSLVLKKDGSKIVTLGDVAQIREAMGKPVVRTHLQGEDSFLVDLRKESEANTVVVAEEAKKVFESFLEENSDKVQGWVLIDQGIQIESAIENVGGSVFHGGVLAGLVIFLLLQNWWPTFVVSLSMPISILITFILMYFTGVSFNLMSLAGLALGVGMLVDNSTVVLDNIHLMQSRMVDKAQAALWGTKTVVGAITGSTLSTIAVFAPLAFVEGMIGQLFRDVAATVCYSLAASLFSAVFVIPMLSAIDLQMFQPKKETSKDPKLPLKLDLESFSGRFGQFSGLKSFSSFYLKTWHLTKMTLLSLVKKALVWLQPVWTQVKIFFDYASQWVLQPVLNRVSTWIFQLEELLKTLIPEVIQKSQKTVWISVFVTVLGIVILKVKGAELFPDEALNRMTFELEFAPGQSLDVTETRVLAIEKSFLKNEKIEFVSSLVGETASHTAKMTFQVPAHEMEIMGRLISQQLGRVPGLAYNRVKEALIGEGKPVQLEIYNEDLGQLKSQVQAVMKELQGVQGLVDLETNLKSDLSEVVVQFSKDRLTWFGVEATGFVSSLKPMLMGVSGGNLQLQGDELPVQVRIPASYFDSIDKVKSVSLAQEEDKRVFLSQVSDIFERHILASIKRSERKRMAVISGNLFGEDLETVSKKIQKTLQQNAAFKEIKWKMGGQDEERKKSEKSLMIAVLMSVFLIYLLLAGQFENLVQPIIVLCAVPFCISGIALFLVLFNQNISALVFVGFIIMIGVSVNTSIVMVDFANQLVAEGKSLSEAMTEATVRRMRPILVTTLSGVLGLLPMAFAMGQGAAMQQPLAVTLIGGHLSATILTVLVIPIIYVKMGKKSQHAPTT